MKKFNLNKIFIKNNLPKIIIIIIGLAIIIIVITVVWFVKENRNISASANKTNTTVMTSSSVLTSTITSMPPSTISINPQQVQESINQSIKEQKDISRKQFSDINNKYTIKVELGDDMNSSTVYLNDQKLLENVESVNFDTTGKYLYYTRFEVKVLYPDSFYNNPERIFDGKIYRYNIETKKEDVMASFKKDTILSMKANSLYIVYGNTEGEVGLIFLNKNNEKKVLTTLDVKEVNNLPSVVSIDNQFATVRPNDKKYWRKGNKRLLKINLATLQITEIPE